MCLKPIQIINPSKYISLKYKDRFLLSVPCGKCAECQQTISNQWFLRAWYECLDTKNFVYFDTLTYANPPKMSDILDLLPQSYCFNPQHVRNFIEALRIALKRKGVSFRYFIASEYGSVNFTHRPHYHVLFFVDGEIEPEQFSLYVSKYWKHGRTDGIPYKSSNYVREHNTILAGSLPAVFLRACRYVTKYVQKSCMYDKETEGVIMHCMWLVAWKMPDENWMDSVNAKRFQMKLRRHIAQFHRQSKGFGAGALQSIDIKQLFEDGCLFMPSPKGLKVPVPLSTYYKRKLFYDLVEIDGTKTWQLNELGVQYREYRKTKLMHDLSAMFYCASLTYHLGYSPESCDSLADYVYNMQGRINAKNPSTNLMEKLLSVTLFNYVTLSDKERLGHRGIINQFIGNNSVGYSVDSLPPSYNFKQFIAKYVILDPEKEKQLDNIYYHLSKHNDKRQSAFELQQHLESVYKDIRSMFVVR